MVGHLFLRSPTVAAGLERVVAFSRILHDSGRVEVEERGDRVIVFPGCRGLPHPFPRQIAELAAASVLVLLRHATGQALSSTRVAFRHPAPSSLAEHRRIFGVTPSFGAPETEVELPRAVLDLPIAGADPSVLTYLDRYAMDVLTKLPSDDLPSQIQRAIAQRFGQGLPEMDEIATQLGLSPRTLQRRLSKLELSYQVLLDRVRQRFAERYLSESRLSLGEIAFLLGFAELSNFHRAFRRWTGQTPGHYREVSAASLAGQGEPPLS
ncbi:MAG: AraC family transcriptional regulator ligand-binding domain-containing protein [Myxococcota bacterium]